MEISPLKRILNTLNGLWKQFRDKEPPAAVDPDELEEPEESVAASLDEPAGVEPDELEEPEELVLPVLYELASDEPVLEDATDPEPVELEEPVEEPVEEIPEPAEAELPEPAEPAGDETEPEELGQPEERPLSDFAEEAGVELAELENRVDGLVDTPEDKPVDGEASEDTESEIARLQDEIEEVRAVAVTQREPEPQIVPVLPPDSSGVRDVLLQTQATQDTDTWGIDDSANGVEVEVITDVKYDTTTHKITYKTRTLKFDSNGFLVAITAEGADVEVTISGPCPV